MMVMMRHCLKKRGEYPKHLILQILKTLLARTPSLSHSDHVLPLPLPLSPISHYFAFARVQTKKDGGIREAESKQT